MNFEKLFIRISIRGANLVALIAYIFILLMGLSFMSIIAGSIYKIISG